MIILRGKRFTGLVLLAGMISLGIFPKACRITPVQPVASAPAEADGPDSLIQATDPYGLPPDLYNVEEGRVRRNQTLSDLLQPMGLNMQEIHAVSLLPDSLIDARKIKQGNPYLYYTLADTSSKEALHPESVFIYEKDLLNFVVISVDSDSIWARNGRKHVDTLQRVASGTIETSLWESMLSIEANPMLAVELSEVYA